MRKLKSRFGICFRKTKLTSKSQNRKLGFRGILQNRKPRLHSHTFSNVCSITGVILVINFYITDGYVYDSLLLVTSRLLFVCLVFNGTSTQDRSICADCGRVKPTQAAKDGQRETMHNSQYVTQCNTVHNETLQLQKCNNRLSNRMTYLLKYYVSAFTNTKLDHTLPIR